MKDALKSRVEELNKFLDSSEIVIFGPHLDIFKSIISKIEKNISDAMDGIEIETDSKLLENIKFIVLFLFNIYFERPLGPKFTEFVTSFLLLVINWNNNIGKNDELASLAHKTDITYYQFHTIRDLLMQSKKVLYLLTREQNYDFVSDMSKHYLRAFCKEEDKNG